MFGFNVFKCYEMQLPQHLCTLFFIFLITLLVLSLLNIPNYTVFLINIPNYTACTKLASQK